jgi:hypothetical protein
LEVGVHTEGFVRNMSKPSPECGGQFTHAKGSCEENGKDLFQAEGAAGTMVWRRGKAMGLERKEMRDEAEEVSWG